MYKYQMPDSHGNPELHETVTNAVIIIGANGSGKSKLGAWMETHDYEGIHRIGAQRNLNFDQNIQLRSYSDAEELVFYGTTNKAIQRGKLQRWSNGEALTTKLLDDFENVLAALLALKGNQQDVFVQKCKEAEQQGRNHPLAPETVVDKLKKVWKSVYRQRKLDIDDSKFFAEFDSEYGKKRYSANQMSDGERAVLYLAAQVLCVPHGKTLIVDEPEVHLHKSIMNTLWRNLESLRTDCLFIYITHDTQFASMHTASDKYWIRSYDGTNWDIEKIQNTGLPEQLKLEILGNRKDVLFVEGDEGSFDVALYSSIYPDYYIIPCGSCSQVISRTKAFRNSKELHHCKVFGIIDRDYRSEHEIESYKQDDIYTLGVAEVENLFITSEVLSAFATHMRKDEANIKSIQSYVIDKRFKEQIEKQICQSIVAELKYKLNTMDIANKNEEKIKESVLKIPQLLDYDTVKEKKEQKFREALDKADYTEVLKLFNEKGIAKTIGHFFGLQNEEYCPTIVRLAQHGDAAFVEAIKKYMPSEIPN